MAMSIYAYILYITKNFVISFFFGFFLLAKYFSLRHFGCCCIDFSMAFCLNLFSGRQTTTTKAKIGN